MKRIYRVAPKWQDQKEALRTAGWMAVVGALVALIALLLLEYREEYAMLYEFLCQVP